MEDYLPTLRDLTTWGITGLLSILISYIWNKVKKLDSSRIPIWLIYGLALYSVITFCYFSYKYIDSKIPPKLVQHKTFDHQTITLDGNKFEDCTFVTCKLVIEGYKPFSLVRSSFTPDTRIHFGKRAAIGFAVMSHLSQDSLFRPEMQRIWRNFGMLKELPPEDESVDLQDL